MLFERAQVKHGQFTTLVLQARAPNGTEMQETYKGMPPQRSLSSSRGVLPQLCCYGKLCSPMDLQLGASDVLRRSTQELELPPRKADLNEWMGQHGLFRSVPRITDETHRRLMSEVEPGTANSAARYYAEIVRRNEEHARRTGGICPSPPRCPGTPLMIDEEDGDPGHPESAAESQSSCQH